jgi:hypothetical protein
MAMPWNSIFPSDAMTLAVMSLAPAEEPPDIRTISQSCTADNTALRIAFSSSFAKP